MRKMIRDFFGIEHKEAAKEGRKRSRVRKPVIVNTARKRKRSRIRYSEELRQEAIELRNQGMSYQDIGEIVGTKYIGTPIKKNNIFSVIHRDRISRKQRAKYKSQKKDQSPAQPEVKRDRVLAEKFTLFTLAESVRNILSDMLSFKRRLAALEAAQGIPAMRTKAPNPTDPNFFVPGTVNNVGTAALRAATGGGSHKSAQKPTVRYLTRAPLHQAIISIMEPGISYTSDTLRREVKRRHPELVRGRHAMEVNWLVSNMKNSGELVDCGRQGKYIVVKKP